jgi:hypothetical protein
VCSVTETFTIRNLIGPEELLTSSSLVGRLVKKGVKYDNARQMLRRNSVRDGIWRSNLTFQTNGRLFCHEKFRGSENFIKQIIPILAKERPTFHRTLQKLLTDGVLLRPHAEMLLSCPIEKRKTRYSSFDADMAAFEEIRAGRVEVKDTIGERLVGMKLCGKPASSAAGLEAQTAYQVEVSLTNILVEHFRQQNLISWNGLVGADIHQGLVAFNNYPFFAATFSYLAPLKRWNEARQKSIPTPVVFHVCYNPCTIWDMDGFLERMARAGVNKSSRLNILGIIAASDFTGEAWLKAKKEGLLAVNLRQLFGEPAFEVIVKIQELLKNVAGDPKMVKDGEYDVLLKAIESIKTNPFIVDLKSLGFEVLAGFLVNYEGWEEVQLNVKVPCTLLEGVTEREIDVSGQRESWDKVCIIECKAEAGNKPLSGECVRKFFTETVPAFLKVKCPVKKPSYCRAEIWTTGTVTSEAENALKVISLGKYIKPALVGKAQLIEKLPKTLGSTKRLIETIAELGNTNTTQQPTSLA